MQIDSQRPNNHIWLIDLQRCKCLIQHRFAPTPQQCCGVFSLSFFFFSKQRFCKKDSCNYLREKRGILGTLGAVGLLTTISSLLRFFIVQSAPFVSKTEAFNIFKTCLLLSCGAHADGAKQGHPEFSSSHNWT